MTNLIENRQRDVAAAEARAAELRREVEELLEQRRAGRSAWAYFNNDIGGDAIEDARTLKAMVA